MTETATSENFGAIAARYKLTEGLRPFLLLTFLCLCLFAPGLAQLPPTDRDESRFMQATKQMIETGNFIDIRFQDEPRNKKPVGIYWLQAAAVKSAQGLFGAAQALTSPWPYRLPSVLAAWIAVLATFALGRRLFDAVTGLAAGAMLATCLIVVTEAHLAKTDAALLAAVTLCFSGLGQIYVERAAKLRPALQFWLGLAAGILIKGPVILAVAGPCLAALVTADRNIKWLAALRPISGVFLLAAITAPWFLMQSSGGNSFLTASWQEDILPKLIGGQETHGAWPGTHLLMSLVTAWPWSVLAPFALIAAWRRRAEPAVRFCLAWLLPAWLLFELIPTKLPHYTLPLMPPLLLLTAALLRAASNHRLQFDGRWALAWRVLWAWAAIALGVIALAATRRFGDGAVIGAAAAAAITLMVGLYAMAGLGRAPALTAGVGLGLTGAAFAVVIFSGVLPHLSKLAISDRIAAGVMPSGVPVALAGYHEPSAVFLLGTDTILTDVAGAAAHLIAHPAARAIVPVTSLDLVRAALAGTGRRVVQIEQIDGYNYSRGRLEHLALITIPAAGS